MAKRVLAREKSATWEIKKSKFLVHLRRVETVDEATEYLAAVSDRNATHNCWAYCINGQQRCSDDGEPSGTAGRPILTALERSGLDQIIAVVTRYFGGIKLGAGGLVRAYGGTVSDTLREASTTEIFTTVTAHFSVPFSMTGMVYHFLEQHPGEKLSEEYLAEGIDFVIKIKDFEAEKFCADLVETSNGKITAEIKS